MSDYEYEIVCETDNNQSLLAYNFYGDYILYTSGNSLYRLSDNENASVYSVQEGYEIGGIQCQDNQIFINIGSGAFCQCIMEIDIDGNIIELIHED